jgi:2'-5' RNA ligase
MAVPLILTLQMEEDAFSFFNALRKIYFPAERNFIDAHLTLFHLLPHEQQLIDTVYQICQQQSPFLLRATEPVSIGRGVAYKIECPALVQLHKHLQGQWKDFLSPQDKQGFRPHVTVQNKVGPEEAGQLLQFLKENFGPFEFRGTALQLWEYHGGPWKHLQSFSFPARYSNMDAA